MNELNKQQYLASLPDHPVSLVIAGAGTGKTKVLVERVENVIVSGITKPENILILTFSSKAAEEIKNRVKSGGSKNAQAVTSGTFHSFCLGLLKDNATVVKSNYGFKNFPSVIDKEEKDKLLRELLRPSIDRFHGLPLDVVSGLLENNSDKRMSEKLKRLGILEELDNFNKQFKAYKISNNLIDFKDMMDFTIDILSLNSSIRKNTACKYKYILVDEFQDTSEDNFKLLNLLMDDGSNLFLVGDDWQSIYAFRGSSIGYIINMKKYFPGAKIYKLTLNYRSKKEIVKLSNDFIRRNKYRTAKKLKSLRGGGGLVNDYCINSLEDEIEAIKEIINIERNKNSSKDIAVLYRNNWQGSYLTGQLKIAGINTDHIKFMTMHTSKGLEFEGVIISGIADEIIPGTSGDIQEERRLLYVALTRARDRLYVIHRKTDEGKLSLFAKELGFAGR